MSKHTDLAWAAGLFDGEGWVFIKERNKFRRLTLVCGVTNTETALLEPFLIWGGRLRPRNGTALSKKPVFEWRIEAQKAARFLSAVYPFLRGAKREKAKSGIALQLLLRKKRARSVDGRFLETSAQDRKWRSKAKGSICR